MSSQVTSATSPALRTSNERRRIGSLAWHVGALLVLAVVLYPVIWVLGASFKPSKDIIASLDLLPTKPVWANFSGLADGISGISITSFFTNSLMYAGLAVVGVVISSSLTAYAFAKEGGGIDAGMDQALAEIQNNPSIPEAQKKMLIEQMKMASGAMSAIRPPQENIDAVTPYLEQLKPLFD